MKQLPDEFVVKLKEECDIVELAEEYFQLTKTGNIYQAKCTHGDRNTASLTFFSDTNTYYCFGCGAGSRPKTEGPDAISFIMWMENCSFLEAVNKLAMKMGVEVPRKNLSADDKKKQDLLNRSLKQNRDYWRNLQFNDPLLKYLEERNITKEDVDKWRIGFVKPEEKYYPNRIAFAIMNGFGQTVGFSYRNMEDKFPSNNPDNGPKYVNSAQSMVFNKGHMLYGLHNIKRLIREKNYMIISEGFGDAIVGQRYGLPIASIMGTSLTKEHIAIIKRYTNNVIIWLDGDAGGVSAALRHLDPLRKEGLFVKVFHTPGYDPDDFIVEKGEEIESYIQKHACLAGQFEIDLIMAEYRSRSSELKLVTAKAVKDILDRVETPIEYQIYTNQVAHELMISPDVLLERVGENVKCRGNVEGAGQEDRSLDSRKPKATGTD